ncbi:MAG: hypothetical protein Q7S40_27340 [Opitutaceae bacterium]|nr:hypothetical protein [Opitutaceae bacterium]
MNTSSVIVPPEGPSVSRAQRRKTGAELVPLAMLVLWRVAVLVLLTTIAVQLSGRLNVFVSGGYIDADTRHKGSPIEVRVVSQPTVDVPLKVHVENVVKVDHPGLHDLDAAIYESRGGQHRMWVSP